MTDDRTDTLAPILDTFGPDPRPPLTSTEPVDLTIDGSHAGLGALVELRTQANLAAKRLALRRITPPVAKILTIAKVDRLFGVTSDAPGRC